MKPNRSAILCAGLTATVATSVRADAPKPISPSPKFHVIAFYTGKNDLAHISFVNEANKWFPEMAKKYDFSYESTSDWTRLNASTLANCQLVMFLDTRPEDPSERAAFRKYMEDGGAWIGFHFSAFELAGSSYPDNWDWYHDTFLGSGEFVSNTWRPTWATLRVEDRAHPSTSGLPSTFKSAPNEWYRWKNDLRKNPDIDILVSIDPSSFPLGTGPKPYEIWHDGYYPVVWTNRKFRMVYINMGHNDMDYDGGTNKQLSSTFGSADQDQLIVNSLLWLGEGTKAVRR
jgi:hypothetical protein